MSAQLASCFVNLVKPDNDVSIQKLSDRPYTEMAQSASSCVNLVKPEKDVNIQMIFDKLYVEVQGEFDEVSAIGGGEEMNLEELMSIDGSEDEQFDDNEVIRENDEGYGSISSLQEQGGTMVSEDSDNNEVISENSDVLAQMVAIKDMDMDSFDFEAFSMSSLQDQGGTTVSED